MSAEKRLRDLKKITSVLADQALLPVAAAAQQVRLIEDQIAEIQNHRDGLARGADDVSIAANMLRQAERLRVAQAEASVQLAKARAELDSLRHDAAQAVGKDRVVETMIDQGNEEKRRRATRRLYRGE